MHPWLQLVSLVGLGQFGSTFGIANLLCSTSLGYHHFVVADLSRRRWRIDEAFLHGVKTSVGTCYLRTGSLNGAVADFGRDMAILLCWWT